ncbi:phage tail protein (plasmid) [Deinococcus metallilatus]|uniref:Microcystin-dependent protein n=1 Tax=Deinococcus metallilatus TaxID=1211322 RepID=A0ABR6MNM7_9DEIO|nr:tail fiber protein [Deinococcus metallilatus]MBB5293540.1 microcystin-dependent protein [Deinococcus metallilatus]QBY06615.1 phage tail protein [Deinococcus metallilatus]RXJ17958.1 phage tail protein [Deinococcus metallilatus]GMA15239.1 tail Collar domain-containing protein [Deinococcus metallilatus]
MAEPFLSEIRIMSFNFAPRGWALCNGQLLPINQNQALFSLLGTTYGGDGRTTFALPNLQGRVPIHAGSGHTLGERGGEEAHTLSLAELPAHTHALNAASSNGSASAPANAFLGAFSGGYQTAAPSTSLHPASVTGAGGSQPHENRQPFLTLTYCIALQGIFPTPN